MRTQFKLPFFSALVLAYLCNYVLWFSVESANAASRRQSLRAPWYSTLGSWWTSASTSAAYSSSWISTSTLAA